MRSPGKIYVTLLCHIFFQSGPRGTPLILSGGTRGSDQSVLLINKTYYAEDWGENLLWDWFISAPGVGIRHKTNIIYLLTFSSNLHVTGICNCNKKYLEKRYSAALKFTDDKRNQIRWFRRNSHIPLCMLESKTSEVVVLFLSLFCLVLCTSNSFRWAICIWIFFKNFRHSPARVWEQCFKS